MPRGPLEPLLRHIRTLAGGPASSELTDEELLRRFVSQQDETSFALLVERHGRLVRTVCRHLLASEEDVEDAFQATLLVLARKASSIRKHRSVASWLYGVAYRTALKARTSAARRQKYERRAPARPQEGPVSEAALRELQALLDEEVQRLPEKLRAPFVLCCLEGKSKGEAARELGWPEGTVSGRVALARKRLQGRLARRGLTLAAALCALAVAEGAATAGLVVLAPGALEAARAFAAGNAVAAGAVSVRAVTLAEAVLGAEAARRLKVVLAVGLVLGLAGAGAGAWWSRTADDPPRAVVEAAAPNDPAPADPAVPPPPEDKAAAPAPGPDAGARRTFAGRVLDADGRPRAGAVVALTGLQNVPIGERGQVNQPRHLLAQTRADAQGRFTLALPDAAAADHFGLTLVASGDGSGPGWELLPGDGPGQNFELRLERAHAIRGRLLDPEGRPADGVEVRVIGLARKGSVPKSLLFPDPGEPGTDLAPPVRTDGDGAFEVRGFPGCEVQLLVRDERFAPQWVLLTATAGERTEAGPVRLAPRRTLEGTVVCVETGRPLAGVHVTGLSAATAYGPLPPRCEDAHTDAEGRFRLHPFPGQSVTLLAYPPAAEPYLIGQHYVEWPDDEPRRVTVTLRRGVVLRGRVTEKDSGRAVAGANVSFHPRTFDNPILSGRRNGETNVAWWQGHTVSGADGGFRVVALPGPGHLLVKGPTSDYVPVETTTGQLQEGRPGREPAYPDGLVPLDLAPGSGPRDVPVVLRRGVTLKGRVVGADGQPVPRAVVVCPSLVHGTGTTYQGTALAAVNGRFELPGRDPDRAAPVFFCDPQRGQGARAELAGSGEPTVRLAPCRSAVVRFVDGAGKPAVGARVALDLVVHPRGAPADVTWHVLHSGYAVPASTLAGPRCMTAGPGAGETTFSGLIPGATYLIEADEGRGLVVKKEFTVKPDEDPQLAEIVVRRAPAPPPAR